MTISSIVICIIMTIFIVIGIIAIAVSTYDIHPVYAVLGAIIGAVLITLTWFGGYYLDNYTEAGRRELKTQNSNFHGGIEREVTVYDMNGDVIEHFQGKFDVEYKDERVMFDDENGNRHIIYFKSGTVIINEVSQGDSDV